MLSMVQIFLGPEKLLSDAIALSICNGFSALRQEFNLSRPMNAAFTSMPQNCRRLLSRLS